MKALLGPLRPNFLLLPPVCVLVGAAAALLDVGQVPVDDFILVLVGALLAHASVNLLNEYEDFRSGLDNITVRTPFSGGSGTLPAHPELAGATRLAGYLTLAGTGAIGLYFTVQHGLALLPLGIAGLALIYFYTTWITRRPMICLAAPGLGFGPLMVMGTAFVLTGQYSMTALFASLPPMFLVSGLLLLNQFPDLEPDRQSGRHHLPIQVGRKAAAVWFVGLLVLAFLSVPAGWALGLLPASALWALIAAVPAVPLAIGALRHADDIPRLVPFMGLNVAVVLLTPALLAFGLWLAT